MKRFTAVLVVSIVLLAAGSTQASITDVTVQPEDYANCRPAAINM